MPRNRHTSDALWGLSVWEDNEANTELTEHLQDLVYSIRVKRELDRNNTLVYGPTRTGKTSSLKFFMRCLLCHNLDHKTLNPCKRECPACRAHSELYGAAGIEQQVNGQFVHCLTIDCTMETEATLRELLIDMRSYNGVRVLYFDEVHRLARRNMDELLLKQSEDKDFIWLASAVSVNGLEEAFLNRFSTKIRTEVPSVEDLASWIRRRCERIHLEWDDDDTLLRLAQRANGVPGLALQVIARANRKRDRQLSKDLVELHRFKCDD